VDLDQLKTFLHVADAGSLTLARDRLHLSQPAISRQLKLLEESVGVDLFVRTGRGVRLTTAGEALQKHARPLVSAVEQLPDVVRDAGAVVSGEVRFATPPSLGTAWIADLVEAVRSTLPGVRLVTKVALSGAVKDGLLRGKLDLGVVYAQLDSPQLKTQKLWREELLLVEGTGRRRRKRRGPADEVVPLSEALARPLVLPGLPHGLRAIVEHAAHARGVPLDVVTCVESLRVQTELVRRQVGACFLPARAVEPALVAGDVVVKRTRPKLTRQLVLAWPVDRPRSPATEAVLSLIQRQGKAWSAS